MDFEEIKSAMDAYVSCVMRPIVIAMKYVFCFSVNIVKCKIKLIVQASACMALNFILLFVLM